MASREDRLRAFKHEMGLRLAGRPLPHGGEVGPWKHYGMPGDGSRYERTGWPGECVAVVHRLDSCWEWVVWSGDRRPGRARVGPVKVLTGRAGTVELAKAAADRRVWTLVAYA